MTITNKLNLLVAVGLLLAGVASSQTPPSQTLSVSALLKHSFGDPVTGTVDVEFSLYDVATGGVPLWQELHTGVWLGDGGRILVRLGTITPITAGLFDTPDRWMALNVNGDGEMTPRMPLSPMPYAFNADSLGGVPAADHATEAELSDMDPGTSPVHWADLASVPAGFADGTDDVDDADSDPTNELQSWATLPGIPAGFADDTDDVVDADNDPTNELQSWATLPGIPAGFADGIDHVDDADNVATNELNSSVVLMGTTLRVTDAGGTIGTSLASLVDDADADPTNELQTWMTLPGIPAGFADDTDDVVDADASPSNEHNSSLVLNGTTLELTDLGGTLMADLASIAGGALPPLGQVIWVATNGTPAGPGNIDSPFDTPQAGYDAAAALGAPAHGAVVIAAGRYSTGFVWEDLDMHAGDVHVFGLGQPLLGTILVSNTSSLTWGGSYQLPQRVVGITALNIDVTSTGGQVSFRDCRVNNPGSDVDGSEVEFHGCHFNGGTNTALRIGQNAPGAIHDIGLYGCTLRGGSPGTGTLVVDGPNRGLYGLDVIGCQIINDGFGGGPAVVDGTASLAPGTAMHNYSHNVLVGPPPGGGDRAFHDIRPYGGAPVIVFTHNTVHGDVGEANFGSPAQAYFSGNTVYGIINHTGGNFGWVQAGAPFVDPAGNMEDSGPPPTLPAAWRD